ncbi:MAG: ABC transporter permease [Chloroflexi bacterium]|nr:ABC transporter permease [Chloroflexota bacterium]MBI4198380.1 ABC transporter permease [Chloroflexota bacterium]
MALQSTTRGRAALRTTTWGQRLRRSWTGGMSFVRRRPLGAISAFFLLVMTFAAVFAEVIAPYGPYQINPIDSFVGPSRSHLFGTDQIGRDVFSRVVFGSRISLQVGIMAVGIGLTTASFVGILSGYIGGRFDTVMQRISDALQTIPGIVLAMALVSILQPSLTNVMFAISFVIIPFNQRVVRSAVLSIKENTYIEAARAIGASRTRIMFAHVLPNVVAPIIVLASILFGFAILTEAGLSFLGLGTPPPTPSWGMMLSGEGRQFMESAPWLSIFPGVAITLAVLAFNLFGDALRDALDPRLRGT